MIKGRCRLRAVRKMIHKKQGHHCGFEIEREWDWRRHYNGNSYKFRSWYFPFILTQHKRKEMDGDNSSVASYLFLSVLSANHLYIREHFEYQHKAWQF